MKYFSVYPLFFLLILAACGTSKTASGTERNISEELREKNRVTLSLLDQIRQKPGIIIRNNRPYIRKMIADGPSTNPYEPLYILDDFIVGNSFNDINQLIANINVKKIEILTGSEAAFYGSRGGSGVIKITSYK